LITFSEQRTTAIVHRPQTVRVDAIGGAVEEFVAKDKKTSDRWLWRLRQTAIHSCAVHGDPACLQHLTLFVR